MAKSLMRKGSTWLATAAAVIALGGPAQGATLEPRDLAVTDGHIAVTHPAYPSYLWIVDRRGPGVAAAIHLDRDDPSALETTFGDATAAELLIATDPASVLLPTVSLLGERTVLTLRHRLDYRLPGDYRVQNVYPGMGDALHPLWSPARSRIGERFLSRGSGTGFPLIAYHAAPSRLVIGVEDPFEAARIDLGDRRVGEGDLPDAIADLPRGKVYVPFSRDEAHGVLVVDVEAGTVDEIALRTNRLGSRGAVSPDGSRLYLVFEDVWAIDLERRAVAERRPLGYYGFAAAAGPDGHEIYVLGAENFLEARDAKTLAPLWRVDLPLPE